jgi:hypothetical protein
MPDDMKIRLAVIALLCVLPVVSAVIAVVHASRKDRRIQDERTRGFGVILNKK